MEELDCHLFIEIILSEGVQFLRREIIEGDTIEFYQGRNGKKVGIFLGDEFLSAKACSAYLSQLGCDDIIPRLFPKE